MWNTVYGRGRLGTRIRLSAVRVARKLKVATSMLVTTAKRASPQTTTTTSPLRKRQRKTNQIATTSSRSTKACDPDRVRASILIGAAAALDDSHVFRPAAHIAPADVNFVSGDKEQEEKRAFAVHSFVLKMRSPVFSAMLEGHAGGSSACAAPIELNDRGTDLRVLFEAMYSNDPQRVINAGNVVSLCALAHKYGATELRRAALEYARTLVKHAKLSGTSPTIPELLTLGQSVQDDGLLAVVLKRGMAAFCSRSSGGATVYCSQHTQQPLPCPYGCIPPPQPELLDDPARQRLTKLNPSTLVALIDALVMEFAGKATSRRPRQPY